MSVVVFLGPSLARTSAEAILPAIYLPPVRRGAVLAALEAHAPRTVAILDGYFEQVPAVWHKEILFALRQGVQVWGAASMGALRAAELAQFGMRGHGAIFEAYMSGGFAPFPGPFEDDDEVAVVHGPAAAGYPSTLAMVDLRATLARAVEADVIALDAALALAAAAKAIFYKRRDWGAVLATGAGGAAALGRLSAWLPEGAVSQKSADAEGLLRHLAADPPPLAPPDFHFERTLIWEIARGGRDA